MRRWTIDGLDGIELEMEMEMEMDRWRLMNGDNNR